MDCRGNVAYVEAEVKAKRVEHLQIEILVMSWKIVVQMLNPYRDMPRIKKNSIAKGEKAEEE